MGEYADDAIEQSMEEMLNETFPSFDEGNEGLLEEDLDDAYLH